MIARPVRAACALAVGLGALSMSPVTAQDGNASRESALSRFLMEQALVHMHARGDALVPKSRDAYMPRVPIPDANALFERAGGKPLARPTLGANEQLLEQAILTTYQMLLSDGIPCCLCSVPATCTDGLFCNGGEICTSGICAPGVTPCVDGDPCTTDSCVEVTDSCSFSPVPPPAEVARLDVTRSDPASSVATITWSAVTGASAYNVYRGASANLGDLACFQSGVTETRQDDDGALPARAFYFLVSSLACSESSLGTGNPSPRPPAPGCP